MLAGGAFDMWNADVTTPESDVESTAKSLLLNSPLNSRSVSPFFASVTAARTTKPSPRGPTDPENTCVAPKRLAASAAEFTSFRMESSTGITTNRCDFAPSDSNCAANSYKPPRTASSAAGVPIEPVNGRIASLANGGAGQIVSLYATT